MSFISYFAYASVFIVGLHSIGLIIKDGIKEEKGRVKKNSKTDIQLKEKERSIDEVLDDVLTFQDNDEDYYTDVAKRYIGISLNSKDAEEKEKYSKAVQENLVKRGEHIEIVGKTKTDKLEAALSKSRIEEEKYIRTLADQKQRNKIISITGEPLSNVGDEKTYLDKEETMKQLSDDIAIYQSIYKLPPLDITPFEWETFFEHVYSFFCEHDLQSKFYDMMAYLNRFVLANGLICNSSNINIQSYVESLKLLVNTSWGNEIKNEDVENLIKWLKDYFLEGNIIQFSTDGKKKKR